MILTTFRKGKVWLALIALAIAISGCAGGPRSGGIESVQLTCAEGCKSMGNASFAEETFDEESKLGLDVFRNALGKADKAERTLNDFDVTFWMNIDYKDGTRREFALNIDRDPSRNAMVVDLADSRVGYRIPVAETKALRQIIF